MTKGKTGKENTAKEIRAKEKAVILRKNLGKEKTPAGTATGTRTIGARTTTGAKVAPTRTTAANLRSSKKKRPKHRPRRRRTDDLRPS